MVVLRRCFWGFLLVLTFFGQLKGATFTADFNNPNPAGFSLLGNAAFMPSGGYKNSGFLQLTDAQQSQAGLAIINDFNGGLPITSFEARFKLRLDRGSAVPADGFSFNYAVNYPTTTAGGLFEDGAGSGLSICFDLYPNTDGEAPVMEVRWMNQVLASSFPDTGFLLRKGFADVYVRYAAGMVDVVFDGAVIFNNVVVPPVPQIATGLFAFAARTGGATAFHFVDDVSITVSETEPFTFILQPQDVEILSGARATFRAVMNSLPPNTTYQWFKNGTAIEGATNTVYQTEELTEAEVGDKYHAEVNLASGPIRSREAEIKLSDRNYSLAPDISYGFDYTPEFGEFSGVASFDSEGGVNGSGMLMLTQGGNDQYGTFSTTGFPFGVPVLGFRASLQLNISSDSDQAADGFSFNLTPNFDPRGFMEEGLGGLSVCLDLYNNFANEAPSIEVKWNGTIVSSKRVPLAQLKNARYTPLVINMETNGLLTVLHDNVVIFKDLAVPYQAAVGNKFVLGARTGGVNARHYVDNLQIQAILPPAPEVTQLDVTDTAITVSWEGGGILQKAAEITGPWEDIADSTSPYTYEFQEADLNRFFRVKLGN